MSKSDQLIWRRCLNDQYLSFKFSFHRSNTGCMSFRCVTRSLMSSFTTWECGKKYLFIRLFSHIYLCSFSLTSLLPFPIYLPLPSFSPFFFCLSSLSPNIFPFSILLLFLPTSTSFSSPFSPVLPLFLFVLLSFYPFLFSVFLFFNFFLFLLSSLPFLLDSGP